MRPEQTNRQTANLKDRPIYTRLTRNRPVVCDAVRAPATAVILNIYYFDSTYSSTFPSRQTDLYLSA